MMMMMMMMMMIVRVRDDHDGDHDDNHDVDDSQTRGYDSGDLWCKLDKLKSWVLCTLGI